MHCENWSVLNFIGVRGFKPIVCCDVICQTLQELQKKREAKRAENKRIAEEEIAYLQANGKVSRTPTHKLNVAKKTKSKGF